MMGRGRGHKQRPAAAATAQLHAKQQAHPPAAQHRRLRKRLLGMKALGTCVLGEGAVTGNGKVLGGGSKSGKTEIAETKVG